MSIKINWISVEKRNPPINGTYLIYHCGPINGQENSGRIDVCYYEPDPMFGWEEVSVTHWAALPTPPETLTPIGAERDANPACVCRKDTSGDKIDTNIYCLGCIDAAQA